MDKNRAIQSAGLILVIIAIASGVSNTATNLLWMVGLVVLLAGSWRVHQARKARRVEGIR